MNKPSLSLGSLLEQISSPATATISQRRHNGSVIKADFSSAAKGDTEAAIEFLIELDPEGRHDLAALDPNTPGEPECATFLANEREKMRRWIAARQGKVNLYPSVNRARDDAPRDKRLSRADIGLIRAIPADIDVPKLKDGDPSGQHFRALRAKLLNEVVPEIAADLECPPSFIVDSGGGVQLWWIFNEPIPATTPNIELVKGIGRAINARIGAKFPGFKLDTVTDPPRIMRLPGTINVPDAGKKAQGRSSAPATVLCGFSSEERYSLDELKAWAPPATKPRQSGSSENGLPQVDMAVVRSAGSYDELSIELRTKFERACDETPSLRNLWNGHQAPWQTDITRSGYMFALAWGLKRDGRFTPTEFGQLLYVWEHSYPPDELDARRIARDFEQASPPTATSVGLDPVEIDESKRPADVPLASRDGNSEEPKPFVNLAKPFGFPDAKTIPPTDWLVENLAARREVTVTTGPGGVSKSTWALHVAVATVTGRSDICGFPIPKRQRVWVWNQEDSLDMMNARLLAIMQEFNVTRADLLDENGQPMLFLNSGRGRENRLTLATRKGEIIQPGECVSSVIETIRQRGIGLAIFEPLVSLHQASENSNEQMRAVFDILADIACAANCAVHTFSHTGKPDKKSSEGFAGDAYAGRGASAQPDAARVATTFMAMSKDDPKHWSISDGSHLDYVRVDEAKSNLGPKCATPHWFRRKQVLVPGYRGGRLPVLQPVILEPKGAVCADDTAKLVAMAISDHHPLETWVPVSMLTQHVPALSDKKNRARTLDQTFAFGDEIVVSEMGTLKKRTRRGAKGTELMLSRIPHSSNSSEQIEE